MQYVWRIAAGVVLAALAVIAHLVLPDQPSALASETIRSFHGPGFGVVSIVFMLLLRGIRRPVTAYIQAAGISLGIALLAEAAQIPGAREAQLSDIGIDALGIIGFLCCAGVLDRQLREAVGSYGPYLLALVGFPALIATIWPTAWLTYALHMRAEAMPHLLGFEERWERTYATGDEVPFDVIPAPDGWPQKGNIARLHTSGQFGLMLHLHPYPDWRDYSAISFVAATTDRQERRIAVGFWGIDPGDGSKPSRYYRTRMIFPEPIRHCIPLSELHSAYGEAGFDLEHVSEILLGSVNNAAGEELLVDDFRLESSPCPTG